MTCNETFKQFYFRPTKNAIAFITHGYYIPQELAIKHGTRSSSAVSECLIQETVLNRFCLPQPCGHRPQIHIETKRWEFFFTENPDFTSFEDVNSSGPL